MLEELQRRNYSDETIRSYMHAVEDFARRFNCPPDRLGPQHIRQYQAELFQKRSICLPRLTACARQEHESRLVTTQFLLHVAVERIEIYVFRSQAMGAMFAIHPSPSLRLADANPIRRPIAGTTESARVHQGLQQERPVAIAEFPIPGKLTCALAQNFAGQSSHMNPRRQQEATVVHHQL